MKSKELQLMYKELDYGVDIHNNIIYLSLQSKYIFNQIKKI